MNSRILSSKKFIIVIVCAVVLAVVGVVVIISARAPKPYQTFQAYEKAWESKNYKKMYSLLSKEAKSKISKDDFIQRYEKIYDGIEASNIKLTINKGETKKKIKGDNSTLDFSVQMDTLAGNVDIKKYHMTLKREEVNNKDKWTVNWSENLIFPELGAKDKVRATTISPSRGEITDRNGNGLAVNGTLNTIIIVPSKFNAVKDTALPQIAQILDMSQDKIQKLLDASTNPEWAVPIVTLSTSDKDKATKLTALPGVQYQKTKGRVYPGGEALGNLIGYTGAITSEELKAHKGEGYTAQDKIGKMGLEQVYEKRLRGEKGGEIYIAKDGDDKSKVVIAKKEAKNGENIKLSIDLDTQKKIYANMNGAAGAAAAVQPKTGQILALVSSPSFDSNLFSTYVPDTTRNNWKTATKDPFTNRFKAVSAPGSTFKLVTAAIGLKTNTINPTEALEISGTQWQPDSSWGSYKITRVDDIGKPVNLQDAFIYSDNIYFAKQALKIGKDNFIKEAKNFGIGEKLPIDYPFANSQLSNSGLSSDQLLADTGYGQGEVQLSPLNVALVYSSLANNGDIMTPVLEMKDNTTAKVWKEKAIAEKDVQTLKDDLAQVVENPSGTAYTNPACSIKLLGKTGTAELKKSQDDTSGEENGWFVAMDTENQNLVIAMMIEDTKTLGGSHYVVPIVKKSFEDILK